MALVSVLILTPWAVRNARRLGAPVWLRSNFGLELWIAYHDPNFAGVLDPGFARWHPATDAQRSAEVRALGELGFNRKLRGEAVAWSEAHPRQAARLTWLHFVSFWFPPGQDVVIRMARALFTLLALAGWILLIRRALCWHSW